ncbi:MAG: PBP1A family penicillin-binding protein [Robiginitomaculum sp.]|nr:PBP1A family penicillin-binding protein [Robiginitomaculum sp.]MDQ7077319.1 PBP1A family penicillin-binding protein [Robiginitomaculum sp.]
MPAFRADILNTEENKRSIRLKWIGATALFFLILMALGALIIWRHFFADIPSLPTDLNQLWTMERAPSLVLQDKEGKPLASRGPRYGHEVKLADLPIYVPQAFMAIEDQRFYEHNGIDVRAITRAALVNARAGRTVQGGSTITQQLIKLLFLTPRQTFKRKVQEMWLAMALDKRLSKSDILGLYLNRVYFGSGAYGIDAAAQHYFSKPAAELTLPEAALLAALPKAPSRLAPDQNREMAQKRANLVLRTMKDAGYITDEQAQLALSEPPELKLRDRTNSYGYIFDMVTKDVQALAGSSAKDLVITSTIDHSLQDTARQILQKALEKNQKALKVSQGAIIVLDMKGAIRALVGGRSYDESKFNRATQALRQPGSAFKPFVFAAAFEKGIDVDAVRYDEPVEIEGWAPQNYGGKFRGRVTLRDAFKRSINTVAVQLTEEVTPAAVTALAIRFGIREDLKPLPSIALGAQEVNLLELTRAYGVFANDGAFHSTYLISDIETTRGEKLYTRPPIPPVQVYETALARKMTSLMQEVILDGTGRRAALRGGRPAAGKTGTSQNWRDAWFVGYSADYIIGVWIGNDDSSPMKRVTGGGLPARIWRDIMTKAETGKPIRALNAPPPHLRSETDEKLAAFYSSLGEAFAQAARPDEAQ